MGTRERQILEIVRSDNTFELRSVRDEQVWVGRCIHCRSALVVPKDGSVGSGVTVEHVLPRNQGGTDEIRNLALACAGCNHEKGKRHDKDRHPSARAHEVNEALAAERAKRWRAPD